MWCLTESNHELRWTTYPACGDERWPSLTQFKKLSSSLRAITQNLPSLSCTRTLIPLQINIRQTIGLFSFCTSDVCSIGIFSLSKTDVHDIKLFSPPSKSDIQSPLSKLSGVHGSLRRNHAAYAKVKRITGERIAQTANQIPKLCYYFEFFFRFLVSPPPKNKNNTGTGDCFSSQFRLNLVIFVFQQIT